VEENDSMKLSPSITHQKTDKSETKENPFLIVFVVCPTSSCKRKSYTQPELYPAAICVAFVLYVAFQKKDAFSMSVPSIIRINISMSTPRGISLYGSKYALFMHSKKGNFL